MPHRPLPSLLSRFVVIYGYYNSCCKLLFGCLFGKEALLRMEKRREFLSRSRVNLGGDRILHRDVLRAVEVLIDEPGATMEAAARLLKECRSSRERRGGKFEEPKSRQVELSPRAYLGLVHEARQSGMSLA